MSSPCNTEFLSDSSVLERSFPAKDPNTKNVIKGKIDHLANITTTKAKAQAINAPDTVNQFHFIRAQATKTEMIRATGNHEISTPFIKIVPRIFPCIK